MHAAKKVMGPAEWALLLTLSILWGGSFFFAKVALAGLPPFTVVFGRVALAALALNGVVFASGRRMPTSARVWGAFAAMGILNNLVPFSLIVWGQTRIASGLASVLNATTPLFTAVLAHFLTRDERLTPGRLGGVLAGLTGVAVMIGPDALSGLGADVLAQAGVLGAALSYAFAGIYGRRFRGTPPLVTAAGQVTASSVMLLPVTLLADRPWSLPAPGLLSAAAVCGLALLCTALAYVIYFRILSAAGATNLLLVTFLIPVSALLLGGLVLGERLLPRQFGGMALIGCGLALTSLRWSAERRARSAGNQPASARRPAEDGLAGVGRDYQI
jgi:drug/metabolite transporter (DMT)-like permease